MQHALRIGLRAHKAAVEIGLLERHISGVEWLYHLAAFAYQHQTFCRKAHKSGIGIVFAQIITVKSAVFLIYFFKKPLLKNSQALLASKYYVMVFVFKKSHSFMWAQLVFSTQILVCSIGF